MEVSYPQILRQYMGEERDGGLEYNNKTTQDAADICGASQAQVLRLKEQSLSTEKKGSGIQ